MVDAGVKMLKAGAMIRTLHENGYIVYEAHGVNPLHEFVLLDDTTGFLKGVSFNDESWERVSARPISRKILTPELYWAEEHLRACKIIFYRDVIGQGPFELVVTGWPKEQLLSVKVLSSLDLKDRVYVPCDAFFLVKGLRKRTWVPRTDAGAAFCHNMMNTHGDKCWDNYVDERGFERLRIHATEWWCKFALSRRPKVEPLPDPDAESPTYLVRDRQESILRQ